LAEWHNIIAAEIMQPGQSFIESNLDDSVPTEQTLGPFSWPTADQAWIGGGWFRSRT
jgi:hypothetical protein